MKSGYGCFAVLVVVPTSGQARADCSSCGTRRCCGSLRRVHHLVPSVRVVCPLFFLNSTCLYWIIGRKKRLALYVCARSARRNLFFFARLTVPCGRTLRAAVTRVPATRLVVTLFFTSPNCLYWIIARRGRAELYVRPMKFINSFHLLEFPSPPIRTGVPCWDAMNAAYSWKP